MKIATPLRQTRPLRYAAVLLALAALGSSPGMAADINVMLSGDQEVPPVTTTATGTGKITIGDDNSIQGSVTTQGIAGTMAHIHEAPAGTNGPPIIELVKEGDTYTVPANTTLTATQLASFKAGKFYINVHTAAYPTGEIRGQLKP